MVHKLSKRVKSAYVVARGIATGLSLLFALTYSKVLGVENRSIITVIFTICLICLTIFTSGIGLFFRSRAQDPNQPIAFRPFVFVALFSALCTASGVLALIYLFSIFRYNIPSTLIIFSVIYSFFGALDDLSHQSLIAYGKFKVAALLDVSTIVVQVIFFFVLLWSTKISSASVLFSSLIVSYICSTFFSYKTIQKFAGNKGYANYSDIKEIAKGSKAFHLVGISSGLADRLDRLLIGLFLPLNFLGTYSVGTSLMTYLRFIPDAVGRLIVAKQTFGSLRNLPLKQFRNLTILILTAFLIICAVFLSQSFVILFLGREWEISRWIIAAFAVQEILRGLYLVLISKSVVNNNQDFIFKSSIILTFGSVIGGYVGIKLFSGIGVPLGIALNYGLLIAYSRVASRKKLNFRS